MYYLHKSRYRRYLAVGTQPLAVHRSVLQSTGDFMGCICGGFRVYLRSRMRYEWMGVAVGFSVGGTEAVTVACCNSSAHPVLLGMSLGCDCMRRGRHQGWACERFVSVTAVWRVVHRGEWKARLRRCWGLSVKLQKCHSQPIREAD
jgi:hypothetical protein